jgi:hypothetical protein
VPFSITALSLSSASAYGGSDNPSGNVTIDYPAPPSGVLLALASSDYNAASVPANVTVAPGGNSVSFTVTTKPVSVSTSVTITAQLNGINTTKTLLVKAHTIASFTEDSTKVVGGYNNNGYALSLDYPAPSTGITIALSSSDTSALTVPASAAISAGGTATNFVGTTKFVYTAHTVVVSATVNGVTKKLTVVVDTPQVASLTLNPTSVVGTNASVGTVTLAQNALGNGLNVYLTHSSSLVSHPSYVLVQPNTNTATFTIGSQPVAAPTQVTIQAKAGTTFQNAVITINPPNVKAVTFSSSSVVGGTPVTGGAVLEAKAPSSGLKVLLSSSNTALATVPASVIVASATYQTFPITTFGVDAATTVTISETIDNTLIKTGVLGLRPASLSSVVLGSADVGGGSTVQARANLDGQAGPSGTVVTLKSSNTSVATVPASVTVAYKSNFAMFNITTAVVSSSASTTISATHGTVSKSALLTVHPAALIRVSPNVSTIVGGNATAGSVVLDGKAPTGGASVAISTSDPSVVILTPEVIPAGSTYKSFTISTKAVTSPVTVTITATYNGVSQTGTITVTP